MSPCLDWGGGGGDSHLLCVSPPWGGGSAVPLSPQDASLTSVLPKLFAEEQLPTGVVSTPRGHRLVPVSPRDSVQVPNAAEHP